jgi:two-component system nitrate/nitrite response regulator NarL
MIRIVIADDHQVLTDGLLSGIANYPEIEVLGTAINGKELVKLVHLMNPDVIITDIRMPGGDGKAAVQELLEFNPDYKIIAFSMFDSLQVVKQMNTLGVKGYVFKSSPLTVLLKAIQTVAQGQTFFDQSAGFVIDTYDESVKLSIREQEILSLIAEGKSSIEISKALFISKATVDTHRKNILQKLQLDGRANLVRFAVENKFNF